MRLFGRRRPHKNTLIEWQTDAIQKLTGERNGLRCRVKHLEQIVAENLSQIDHARKQRDAAEAEVQRLKSGLRREPSRTFWRWAGFSNGELAVFAGPISAVEFKRLRIEAEAELRRRQGNPS